MRGAGPTQRNPPEQTLIARLACPAAQLIESEADGGAMQPPSRAGTLDLGILKQLPKRFDREFLRAAPILDDPDNGTGDGLIVSLEKGVECGRR